MSPRKQNLTIVILAVLCVVAGMAVVLPGSAPGGCGPRPEEGYGEQLIAPPVEQAHGRRVVEFGEPPAPETE